MMKTIMKQKNVSTIQDLIESAQSLGVKLIACTMSMDVMGIREES
jgi:peroxiredoxin family protein